ncbi:MAG: hypothetical protein ACFHVJ_08835 [Aestuariibacter sp.]
MHLKFLCSHHRDWVYFHPQEALVKLEQSGHYGDILLQQDKWREALPFLGCAWETAAILVDLYQSEIAFLLKRLTSQTVALARCLVQLECPEHAQLVYLQVQNTLHGFEGDNKRLVLQCLESLYQGQMFHLQDMTSVSQSSLRNAH